MKAAVLLSLGTLALANPVASGIKVPFARRNAVVTNADGTVNGPRLFASVRNTIRKYNKDQVLSDTVKNAKVEKRANVGSEPLTDQNEQSEDELYFGNTVIGAAKQTFTVDFDTGSSDFFVPGPQCTSSKGCVGKTKYNQKGTNEKNTTTVTYGSGMITGNNYFDTASVAGITASKQNIVSLTSASGFSTSESEGLVGMAFQSIANSKQPSFPFTLFNEKKLAVNEFSFYLGRVKSGTASLSELTLGGRDTKKYTGSFTSIPVISQTYWEVQVAAANVNGKAVSGGAAGAAVDTGTTVVIAPSTAAAAIYGAIPGSVLLPLEGGVTEQFYGYPCSSKPAVSFTLGGKQFLINSLDFNLGSASGLGIPILGPLADTLFGGDSDAASAMCIGGVVGSNIPDSTGKNIYILGDTFLKNWYSSFQYFSPSKATVSLAKAKQAP